MTVKLFFCALLIAISTTPALAAKPNVVLFLVDDMGWMDCGVYGSKYYETPNIDRFATRAMRFTNAYADPLCSPTRGSIMSGKHPARHGILTASGHQPPQEAGHLFFPETAPPTKPMLTPESKNYLEPSEITLAETLKAAGYRTAHIGKWHLGLVPPYRPEQQGFDVAFHCAPDPGPPGGYFSPYGVVPEGRPTAKNKVGTITDGPDGEYIVDRQGIEAVKFIRESKGGPFFLNLWCYGIHGPWGHKPEYTAEFAKKKDPRGLQANPIMASMLRSVDECFGRILDELDQQGLTDNTLIIFYSDNGGNTHSNVPGTAKTEAAEKNKGDALADWRKWAGDLPPTNNAPLREGKGTLYEGGTRVPMMWSWANQIKPATVSDAIVGHIDIYPTVLDLLGLQKPAEQVIDGISIAPVLTGKGELPRKAFFNYFPYRPNEGGVTVRSGDFKLIRWFGPGVPRELYNLRDDIGETTNLAEQMPDKVAELDALIDGFQADTGARFPIPNPAYKPRGPAQQAERPLGGWVPKGCTAELKDGALIVTGENRSPFLGLTALKHPGPVSMEIAASGAAGPARIQWRTADQETFPEAGQIVEFTLPGGSTPSTVTVELPVKGSLLHLRLYLPAQQAPVTLDRITIRSRAPQPQIWNFDK
ncbi:MAG: sulfatase [Verrucomicrobiaceae bacterium]|nr:sulfatase [Verrucomicrobiaceae bacterium]